MTQFGGAFSGRMSTTEFRQKLIPPRSSGAGYIVVFLSNLVSGNGASCSSYT